MKITYLLFAALLSLMVVGCEKDIDPNSACDLTFPFSEVEWKATSIIPSECIWMLFKHEYRGSYYYSVGNHCVDMQAFVAACNGVNICNSNPQFCRLILDKGNLLGIVAEDRN